MVLEFMQVEDITKKEDGEREEQCLKEKISGNSNTEESEPYNPQEVRRRRRGLGEGLTSREKEEGRALAYRACPQASQGHLQ